MNRIGIVVSDTYPEITGPMLNIAQQHITSLGGITKLVAHVSGSFDMPLAVKHMASRVDIDGVVTLGAVIRGETDHDVIVANHCARKIADISIDTNTPIALGVSGPKMTRQGAENRIDKFAKGAVDACFKMIKTLERIDHE